MKPVKCILILVQSAFLFFVSGCQKDDPIPYKLDSPPWFPRMEIPDNNSLTEARVALGKKLFFEPLLSSDSTVSCASCHHAEKAFTDGLSISRGVNNVLGLRNAPTLANIGYGPYFFHDGGVETLELQSQQPIFSETEMNFSIAGFLDRIADNQDYKKQFKEAYDRAPDAFGISRAIASFERTLISSNSWFDSYQYNGKEDALTEDEKRGMQLFFSERTNCGTCHPAPLFTNFEFENIGLYETYSDSGRARISHLASDNGKFKVPTLRNIASTAPYMHDGSLSTLEQVLDHFNAGGVGHVNQSSLVKPLDLTALEKQQIISFLNSLTDIRFLTDATHIQ